MIDRMIDLVVAGLTLTDLSCEEALRVRGMARGRRLSNEFGLAWVSLVDDRGLDDDRSRARRRGERPVGGADANVS
jgi:hypothetical protein